MSKQNTPSIEGFAVGALLSLNGSTSDEEGGVSSVVKKDEPSGALDATGGGFVKERRSRGRPKGSKNKAKKDAVEASATKKVKTKHFAAAVKGVARAAKLKSPPKSVLELSAVAGSPSPQLARKPSQGLQSSAKKSNPSSEQYRNKTPISPKCQRTGSAYVKSPLAGNGVQSRPDLYETRTADAVQKSSEIKSTESNFTSLPRDRSDPSKPELGPELVRSPGELDVLIGTGRAYSAHSGNRRYQAVIARACNDYHTAKYKKAVVNRVIDDVFAVGGRFLAKHTPTKTVGNKNGDSSGEDGSPGDDDLWEVVADENRLDRNARKAFHMVHNKQIRGTLEDRQQCDVAHAEPREVAVESSEEGLSAGLKRKNRDSVPAMPMVVAPSLQAPAINQGLLPRQFYHSGSLQHVVGLHQQHRINFCPTYAQLNSSPRLVTISSHWQTMLHLAEQTGSRIVIIWDLQGIYSIGTTLRKHPDQPNTVLVHYDDSDAMEWVDLGKHHFQVIAAPSTAFVAPTLFPSLAPGTLTVMAPHSANANCRSLLEHSFEQVPQARKKQKLEQPLTAAPSAAFEVFPTASKIKTSSLRQADEAHLDESNSKPIVSPNGGPARIHSKFAVVGSSTTTTVDAGCSNDMRSHDDEDESGEDPKKHRTKKCKWTTEEDEVLRAAVAVHGVEDWRKITSALPGRVYWQCRQRWMENLDPELDDKAPIGLGECRMIMELHKHYGNKWTEIAKRLPQKRSTKFVRHKFVNRIRPELVNYYKTFHGMDFLELMGDDGRYDYRDDFEGAATYVLDQVASWLSSSERNAELTKTSKDSAAAAKEKSRNDEVMAKFKAARNAYKKSLQRKVFS